MHYAFVKIIDTEKAQISELFTGTRHILNSKILREMLREGLIGG